MEFFFFFFFLRRFQSAASALLLPSSRASTIGFWLRSSRRGSSGLSLCPPRGVRKLSLCSPAFAYSCLLVIHYLKPENVIISSALCDFFFYISCSYVSCVRVCVCIYAHMYMCVCVFSCAVSVLQRQKLRQTVGLCANALCCSE